MTRPLGLVDCECWDIGERIMLPQAFKDLIFFDPLFISTPQKGVAIYYNFTDPKQNLQTLIDFLENHLTWLENEKIRFDDACRTLRMWMKGGAQDFKGIAELNHAIWPMVAVANVLGSTETYAVSQALRQRCIQIREESDDVLHPSLTYLNTILAKYFNIHDPRQILLSEFLNSSIPATGVIQQREMGWLYHNGILALDVRSYLDEHNIHIEDISQEHGDALTGTIACKGVATGRAKVIFELSELDRVQPGDVLVTPMTTPEMIPALKKASAIITDEGGITCHAAIVSRELHIPCLIGTRTATQRIHDGDLLEVDADHGRVNVLQKFTK